MWQSFCHIFKFEHFSKINDTFSAVPHFWEWAYASWRDLLERVSLLLKKSAQSMLYFLKVYPKQSLGCWAVGVPTGAVNPQTHCKWVRAFIDNFANLVDVAVSILYSQCDDGTECVHCSEDYSNIQFYNFRPPCPQLDFSYVNCLYLFRIRPHPSHTPRFWPPQIDFDSQKKGNVLNNCTANGIDFCFPQKGVSAKGNAFASHKYNGKSALRYKLGISILVLGGGSPGPLPRW